MPPKHNAWESIVAFPDVPYLVFLTVTVRTHCRVRVYDMRTFHPTIGYSHVEERMHPGTVWTGAVCHYSAGQSGVFQTLQSCSHWLATPPGGWPFFFQDRLDFQTLSRTRFEVLGLFWVPPGWVHLPASWTPPHGPCFRAGPQDSGGIFEKPPEPTPTAALWKTMHGSGLK